MTMTATDGAGNSAQCNFLVLMNDVLPPSLNCPVNSSVIADENCEATLPDFTSGVATDNCATNPTVTQSLTVGTTITANTEVMLVASDFSGNSTSCTFTVEFDDSGCCEGIVLNCPTDITTSVDDGECYATIDLGITAEACEGMPTITYTTDPAIASDPY